MYELTFEAHDVAEAGMNGYVYGRFKVSNEWVGGLGNETVNPPENNRSYSSVWNNDDIGTGHARSMIDSA